jgi:hypothetical protein
MDRHEDRIQKVMHKGRHVANIRTYRGRAGGYVSQAEHPDGSPAHEKYGIGSMDTKREMLSKIKKHHSTKNEEVQIDELSKATVTSYSQKAFNQYMNMTHGPTHWNQQPSHVRDKAAQRMRGMNIAGKKVGRTSEKAKVMATEEGPANVSAGVEKFDPPIGQKKKRVLKRFRDM